jgi:GNAT superfamily N-acetyltransferase
MNLIASLIQRLGSGFPLPRVARIRNAQPSDASAIRKLLYRHRDGLDGPDMARRIMGTRLFDDQSSDCGLVAETLSAGSIVGVAYVVHDEGIRECQELFVHPAWRRKGIGDALLREITRRSEQCKQGTLTLCCRINDIGGLAWLHNRNWQLMRDYHGRVLTVDDCYPGCEDSRGYILYRSQDEARVVQ